MVESRERLKSLRDDFAKLQYGDENELHRLATRGDMLIKRVFGESSGYVGDFMNTSFFSGVHDVEDSYERSIWERGRNETLNLLETMLEDLELSQTEIGARTASGPRAAPAWVLTRVVTAVAVFLTPFKIATAVSPPEGAQRGASP
jgi:hypothetical protein